MPGELVVEEPPGKPRVVLVRRDAAAREMVAELREVRVEDVRELRTRRSPVGRDPPLLVREAEVVRKEQARGVREAQAAQFGLDFAGDDGEAPVGEAAGRLVGPRRERGVVRLHEAPVRAVAERRAVPPLRAHMLDAREPHGASGGIDGPVAAADGFDVEETGRLAGNARFRADGAIRHGGRRRVRRLHEVERRLRRCGEHGGEEGGGEREPAHWRGREAPQRTIRMSARRTSETVLPE